MHVPESLRQVPPPQFTLHNWLQSSPYLPGSQLPTQAPVNRLHVLSAHAESHRSLQNKPRYPLGQSNVQYPVVWLHLLLMQNELQVDEQFIPKYPSLHAEQYPFDFSHDAVMQLLVQILSHLSP